MRFVLADIRSRRGFVIKDTAVGGYGQRMSGFCLVTRAGAALRRRLQDPPSVTLAYLAALLARAGHEIAFTRREVIDGDVALVLSSLVDYRQETAWCDGRPVSRDPRRIRRLGRLQVAPSLCSLRRLHRGRGTRGRCPAARRW
jgi:hypothetical protein